MTTARTTGSADVGVTGLAVMGSDLSRNLARNGYVTAVHNRSSAKTDALLTEHGSDGVEKFTQAWDELLESVDQELGKNTR